MVIPHVKQVVSVRKSTEPAVRHYRVELLLVLRNVSSIVMQASSPQSAIAEIVKWDGASIRHAFRTKVCFLLARHPNITAYIIEIASKE